MRTLKEILNAWGIVGVKALQNDLQRVNATGKTVNSVRYEVSSEGTVDRLVYFARKFLKALETGISPTTKGPSREMIASLTEYAQAKGMDDPKSAAWALAKAIQKEGDKTHRQGGRIVYSTTVEKLAEDIKKDIKKQFRIKFMQTIKGAFVLALFVLSSCGSVQTINGVRIPKDKPNVKNYILVTGCAFGFGYYLGKEVINGGNGN